MSVDKKIKKNVNRIDSQMDTEKLSERERDSVGQ